MVKLNKQTSVTGACVLTIDGKEEQVAFMNANIPVSGTPNISRAIQNIELFITSSMSNQLILIFLLFYYFTSLQGYQCVYPIYFVLNIHD